MDDFPAMLNCYIFPCDAEGFPTATYSCNSWDDAYVAKGHADKWFSRVDIVPDSNGQSPQQVPTAWLLAPEHDTDG